MPRESSNFLLPRKFPSTVVSDPRGWCAAAAAIEECNEQKSLCTPNPLSHTFSPFTIFTEVFTGDDSSPLTTTTNITSNAIVTGTHHLASILAMPGIEELV
ncbi:hypothetical protein NC651_020342 [Populus alba x Populus x berolinensis]|nr:hypothetical protein NC651_020342 [Populus alba x Populus x berolinensis]